MTTIVPNVFYVATATNTDNNPSENPPATPPSENPETPITPDPRDRESPTPPPETNNSNVTDGANGTQNPTGEGENNETEETEEPEPILSTDNFLSTAEQFTVASYNKDGSVEAGSIFVFSLLPAVESRLGSGSLQVPEVKPGILKRVTQNIKNFDLPGGAPVFQVLGNSPTILQMVGLFIGGESEGEARQELPANSKGAGGLYPNRNPTDRYDAQYYAEIFESKYVQSGRPVEIVINSGSGRDANIRLRYKALIQDYRYFITRADRVYYALDVLILDYRKAPTKRNV